VAPTNERFSLRLEWVVLAGIALIALDAAVPSLRGREHETHAGIVQRLHEYADREVGMVHAEAAALGHPAAVPLDGEQIRLVDGFPHPADVPKLLTGVDQLDVIVNPGRVEIRVPSAPEPARCRFEYRLATAPGSAPLMSVDDVGC
jgi:hypothetical protein